MKRLWFITWRLAAGACIALAAVITSTITGVDDRPFQLAPYHAATVARLASAQATPRVVFGPLRAGFGRVRLTPTVGATNDAPESGAFRSVPLAGYGARLGRPATGAHDELWVKAAAFAVGSRTGVVVSADALIIPREIAQAALERIARAHGLTRAQVYFSATHTHASLGGWGEGFVAEQFAGPYNPGTRRWFAQQLAAAAGAALEHLAPATLGHGAFDAPEFVRNRLVGDRGRIDPEFSFLVVRQATGTTAVLGSYAAHATVLSPKVMEFSGDYPGAWQRAVEAATGGTALFLAGGLGSHSPRPPAGGFEGAQRMGEALAAEVVRRLPATPLTNRVAFGWLGLETDLPELHVRIAETLRLRPTVARSLLHIDAGTWLQGLRLGDTVWLATPCDFSGELGRLLKGRLRARDLAATVTSFNGDYIGYVIPSKYYPLDGYEPRTMSFFGPQVPDYFMALLGQIGTLLAEPAPR